MIFIGFLRFSLGSDPNGVQRTANGLERTANGFQRIPTILGAPGEGTRGGDCGLSPFSQPGDPTRGSADLPWFRAIHSPAQLRSSRCFLYSSARLVQSRESNPQLHFQVVVVFSILLQSGSTAMRRFGFVQSNPQLHVRVVVVWSPPNNSEGSNFSKQNVSMASKQNVSMAQRCSAMIGPEIMSAIR